MDVEAVPPGSVGDEEQGSGKDDDGVVESGEDGEVSDEGEVSEDEGEVSEDEGEVSSPGGQSAEEGELSGPASPDEQTMSFVAMSPSSDVSDGELSGSVSPPQRAPDPAPTEEEPPAEEEPQAVEAEPPAAADTSPAPDTALKADDRRLSKTSLQEEHVELDYEEDDLDEAADGGTMTTDESRQLDPADDDKVRTMTDEDRSQTSRYKLRMRLGWSWRFLIAIGHDISRQALKVLNLKKWSWKDTSLEYSCVFYISDYFSLLSNIAFKLSTKWYALCAYNRRVPLSSRRRVKRPMTAANCPMTATEKS